MGLAASANTAVLAIPDPARPAVPRFSGPAGSAVYGTGRRKLVASASLQHLPVSGEKNPAGERRVDAGRAWRPSSKTRAQRGSPSGPGAGRGLGTTRDGKRKWPLSPNQRVSPPPGTVSSSANRSSGLLTKLWGKELINAPKPGSPHSVSRLEETQAGRAPASLYSPAGRGSLSPLFSAPSRGNIRPDSHQTFPPWARDPGLRGLPARPFPWFQLRRLD
ncbi:hypothetical protein P7K49_013538 [Saguinus oedipus]|uniref:Uncharacterized protein n=1 Tax=Saguinus oedipus TaxID=9490 RepID=A0ABQ9VGA7_SAGOE|nr:hypothetical protein P7K49_013538 [Saguinus oedipus]